MTLEEIKHQYLDEWVLIEFTKLDEGLEVIEGEVIRSFAEQGRN